MVAELEMLLSPPSFAGRTQKSPTRSQESVWKRWRARVAYSRCSGLWGSWPMSFTWPSRWPLAFWEMASPRCVPIPQKAVAICFIDRSFTGRPRMSANPRPRSSVLAYAGEFGCQSGQGEVVPRDAGDVEALAFHSPHRQVNFADFPFREVADPGAGPAHLGSIPDVGACCFGAQTGVR